MFRLYWQLSDGTRRYLMTSYDNLDTALKVRWNWAQRGELYKIETPNGQPVD
jgi:hypothetical protein